MSEEMKTPAAARKDETHCADESEKSIDDDATECYEDDYSRPAADDWKSVFGLCEIKTIVGQVEEIAQSVATKKTKECPAATKCPEDAAPFVRLLFDALEDLGTTIVKANKETTKLHKLIQLQAHHIDENNRKISECVSEIKTKIGGHSDTNEEQALILTLTEIAAQQIVIAKSVGLVHAVTLEWQKVGLTDKVQEKAKELVNKRSEELSKTKRKANESDLEDGDGCKKARCEGTPPRSVLLSDESDKPVTPPMEEGTNKVITPGMDDAIMDDAISFGAQN